MKYSYEVEFCKEAIVSERLDYFNPNKANVFERTTDIENQSTDIIFGGKIKKAEGYNKVFAQVLEANTLWNNTVLGGFLKTNIEIHEVKEASDWFDDYLHSMISPRTKLNSFVTSIISKKDVSKQGVVDVLRKADFNISNILIREEEQNIPNGLLEFLESKRKVPSERLSKLKSKGKVTSFEVKLEHTVDGVAYSLPLEQESQGTNRYYGFAGLLMLLIENSVAFPIDELESSLHPELFEHFLLSFLMNSTSSQIIATTHNREILNNRDLFRDDAIWFADKSGNCATELYSLADFDSSVVRDTSNVLNAYKSGKLKGVPNLGDYYIDSES